MSILGNLFIRLENKLKLQINQKDDSLKTHYYKATLISYLNQLKIYFRQDADCRIITVSKDHGEIAVEIDKPIPCF